MHMMLHRAVHDVMEVLESRVSRVIGLSVLVRDDNDPHSPVSGRTALDSDETRPDGQVES